MRYSDRQHDMVQILNEGYKVGGVVIRSEQGKLGYKPFPYAVYGPKAVISRSEPEDISLRSRFFLLRTSRITIHDMRRVSIPLDFKPTTKKEAQVLRNRLLWARFSNYLKVPRLKDGLRLTASVPRDVQLIESILSALPLDKQVEMLPILEAHLYLPIDEPEKAIPGDVVLRIKAMIKQYGKVSLKELRGEFSVAVTEEALGALINVLEGEEFLVKLSIGDKQYVEYVRK